MGQTSIESQVQVGAWKGVFRSRSGRSANTADGSVTQGMRDRTRKMKKENRGEWQAARGPETEAGVGTLTGTGAGRTWGIGGSGSRTLGK